MLVLGRVLVGSLVPLAGLLAGAASAHAAVVVQCIPAAAGATVVSGGAAPGTCAAGSTKVSLPAAAADQNALMAILPYLSFTASGVGGKPTIKVHDANLQIVSGSGSTAGAVNGQGNLVIGYDESPGTHTGSHNLMLGTNPDVLELRRDRRRLLQQVDWPRQHRPGLPQYRLRVTRQRDWWPVQQRCRLL